MPARFKLRRNLLLVASALLAAPGPTAAQVDDIQLKLLRQFPLPLRWDNVEDSPLYRVGGERPARRAGTLWQVTRLAPKQTLVLRIPAGEMLRLVSPDRALVPADVIVRLSQGSGATVRQAVIAGSDGRSLLASGSSWGTSLAYIERPADAGEPLDIAAFVSRRIPGATVAPYRREIPLALPERQVRRANEGGSQRFWQFAAGGRSSVTLRGPARYALQGRFIYPGHEAAMLQSWWLELTAEDGSLTTAQYETSLDSATPVIIDGNEVPATRQKEVYFEVPPGAHRYTLETNGPFLGRILEQESPDYLLAPLNEPAFPARAARAEEASPVLRMATWAQAPEETAAALALPAEAAAVRQAGLELIKDNRRRDGSIIAASALQAAAAARRDAPAIQNEANEYAELHTFYRDLLPTRKSATASQRFAWYLTPQLLDIGEIGRGTAASLQHEKNLLEWMDSGIFISVPERSPAPPLLPAPSATVLFETDSHLLTSGEREKLAALARRLLATPGPIDVVGHTDSRAGEAYNVALSQRRSASVAAFLVRQGIPAARLRVAYHGKQRPTADNGDELGRALNRRVTIATEAPLPAEDFTHAYELPERHAPTRLRIAVHADAAALGQTLFVQFDRQPPIELTVAPTPEVPAELFAPSSGETALLLQSIRHGERGGSTLDGAFSQTQVPGLLIPAGVNELPLPREVRQIRIWRREADRPGERIWLAIKLRVAKPYALSESGLSDSLAAVGQDGGIPRLLAALGRAAPVPTTTAVRDVDSHLQPLARLLRSEYLSLAETVAPPALAGAAGKAPASAVAAARRLQEAGQWLAALEQWNEAATGAGKDDYTTIQGARFEALIALGEPFLAEQLLKQGVIHGPTPADRRQAGERLAAYYRGQDDRAGLLTLAAAAFVVDPDETTLARLVDALLDNQQYGHALSAGLLLPPQRQPRNALLRASLKQEWNGIFQRMVGDLGASPEQDHWQALRLVRDGRLDDGLGLLARTAPLYAPAASWLEHLRRGMRLAEMLRAAAPLSEATLREWGQWIADTPGEREWKDLPSTILDAAGGASLYSIDRDAHFPVARADSERPLRLGFFGPTTLRLEVRPEHRAAAPALLDGWLRIRTSGSARPAQWMYPITQNPPASGLRIVGDDDRLPGRKVGLDLPFGPGWHELEIDGGSQALLVRSQFAVPELYPPLLPLLTRDTVRRPRRDPLPAPAIDFLGCYQCTVLVPPAGSPEEIRRFHADRRLLAVNDASLGKTEALPELPPAPAERIAELLAAGDPAALIALPPPAEEQQAERLLAGLLWLAETRPDWHERLLARASQIAAGVPGNPAVASMLARLARDSNWLPINALQGSAGLRAVPLTGAAPENPALRARMALLPPLAANEYLLSGENSLVLNVFNPAASRLSAELAQADVSGLPALPLTVLWQIDGGPERPLTLDPAGPPRQLPFVAGRGEHSLKLRLAKPFAGQFLRIRLREAGRPAAQTVVDAGERFYHVATPREPLRASLPGPLWLRIDQWKDGRTETGYRYLPDEWNEVVIPPDAGESEGLYRLFYQGHLPDQPVTPPRQPEVASEPVPPPVATLPDAPPIRLIELDDGLPLGGQEDGTWSFGAAAVRRNFAATEHAAAGSPLDAERFIESTATWRYHDPDRRTWYRAALLGRWREDGGPTAGAQAALLHAPNWSSWNFGADAGLYVQQPGGTDGESMGYAYNLRAYLQQRRDLDPKNYHLPEISLFLRHTSLHPGEMPLAYRAGRIDQDIYSPYKAHHPAGWTVSDTLVARPWLDTEWYGSLAATSNPDLNLLRPDRLAGALGWRQLAGPIWTDVRYAAVRGFADAHRPAAQTSRQLSLRLGTEIWSSRLHRLELGIGLAREIDDRQTAGSLTLLWHTGNGRGYFDFRPGEIDFPDLRLRRAPASANNRVTPQAGAEEQP